MDKTGWYSQWQQYSPPQKVYTPAWTTTTTFAICKDPQGKIQFAQVPGQPVTAKVNTEAVLPEKGTLRFKLTEFRLTSPECDGGGEEFRPLQEYDKSKVANKF